ncbi:ATP-binding protein [Candidatus Erwinia dacicola]|nr:ATP-binding protein [Candidatus Erwinia dacicola]
MKLTGMGASLSSQMEQPGTYEELSFRERLTLLVTRESLERDQRKQKRLLQKARLRLETSVHDIDYQPARNLEPSRIAQLNQNEWVHRGQNLLITGPGGYGKTLWIVHWVTMPARRVCSGQLILATALDCK